MAVECGEEGVCEAAVRDVAVISNLEISKSISDATFELSRDILLVPSLKVTFLLIFINLIGVEEDFIPVNKILSTKIFAEPSKIGNS